MYYIYHIPGVKIGCTDNIARRMKAQGFTEWEILERYRNIYTASKREIELQKKYGLPVDKMPYYQTCSIATPEGMSKGGKKVQKIGTDERRKLTFDQAEEIRTKYVPRKYTASKLAKEYKVSIGAIYKIIYNQRYSG